MFEFEISVNLKKEVGEIQFDRFLDEFIDEIEKNKLMFGGGGNSDIWEGVVTSEDKFAAPTINDKEKIRLWLETRLEIENCQIGGFLDVWNDPKWSK